MEFQSQVNVIVFEPDEVKSFMKNGIPEAMATVLKLAGLNVGNLSMWERHVGELTWATAVHKDRLASTTNSVNRIPKETFLAFDWSKLGSLPYIKEQVLSKQTSINDYIIYVGQHTGLFYTNTNKITPGLVAIEGTGLKLSKGLKYDNELLCARYKYLSGSQKLTKDFDILLYDGSQTVRSKYVYAK